VTAPAPVFDYANFIAQFPAFGTPLPEASVEMAWDMGANWMERQTASWGVGAITPSKLQQAADLMGAVVCAQLYGSAAQYAAEAQVTTANSAPGAVESATEGSVTAAFQLPDIGNSGFASMLLSSPPYGRMLLALLQVSASVGPYIASCRPYSRVPP
jgi:hypothetical protein